MRVCAVGLFVLCFGLVGCESECTSERSIGIAGDDYCGDPCSSCGDCEAGFSCQFRSGRGVCVDEAFLTDRGQGTTCVEPCPSGQFRYDDMGTSVCAAICGNDSECDHCCREIPAEEISVCLPRAELCM